MNRRDPRIQQTISRLTDTLENANISTQESLWAFSQSYVQPCLASVSSCLESSCYPCIGARRDRHRARQRHASRFGGRNRPEFVFDFYNDEWDEVGERSGLLSGWGADELDRLLAGSGPDQPRRHGPMNYGSRAGRGRRKSTGAKGSEVDPTIVPGSSMFGFLERLPWKIGGRGVRYKPSAADLQEHPGRREGDEREGEALLEDGEGAEEVEEEEVGAEGPRTHRRKRSETNASRSSENSLSSRGDLFPSEDEDDAIPIDDEFAMVLDRRATNDENSSGKSRARRSTASRTTTSSRGKRRANSGSSGRTKSIEEATAALEEGLPTIEDLKREEDAVRDEEQAEIQRKRLEAQHMAREYGLTVENTAKIPPTSPQGDASEDEDFTSSPKSLHVIKAQEVEEPSPREVDPLPPPSDGT